MTTGPKSPALPALRRRSIAYAVFDCKFVPGARQDTSDGRPTEATSRLTGLARVSTAEQWTDLQLDELRAAGCDEEHTSGADRTWPVLARLPRGIRSGELARSAAQGTCAHFRSLRDRSWVGRRTEPAPVGGNPGLRAGDPETTQAATPPT